MMEYFKRNHKEQHIKNFGVALSHIHKNNFSFIYLYIKKERFKMEDLRFYLKKLKK